MSAETFGFWYSIVLIVRTIVVWLGDRYGKKTKRVEDARKMFREGMKEKDEAKIMAAMDRLKRIGKRR